MKGRKERAAAARPDTWMPWYAGDYLRKTMHFDADQDGAYRRLIDACWMAGGPIKNDDRFLENISRLSRHRWGRARSAVLEKFFVDAQGFLRNERVEQELDRARKFIDHQSNAGVASAEKRANRAATQTQPEAVPLATETQPTPQPNGKTLPPPPPVRDRSSTASKTAARETARSSDALAHQVGNRCLEILGHGGDPAWNYAPVFQWLADGADPERDIYPILQAALASGRKVRSLKYFTPAIADKAAAKVNGNGVTGSNSSVIATSENYGGRPPKNALEAENRPRDSEIAGPWDHWSWRCHMDVLLLDAAEKGPEAAIRRWGYWEERGPLPWLPNAICPARIVREFEDDPRYVALRAFGDAPRGRSPSQRVGATNGGAASEADAAQPARQFEG